MNNMIKSRGCKRCGGDLAMERDTYGVFFSCIQCGAEYPILSESIPVAGSIAKERREVTSSSRIAGAARR